MQTPTVNKNLLDTSRLWSTYIAFGGDLERTKSACSDVDPVAIENLACIEGWPAKLARANQLQGDLQNDVQIKVNRAVNYVQAHRLRGLVDNVVGELWKKSPEELIEALTVQTKNGPEFRTRALCDLVKAAETAHLMTQRALGDTASLKPSEAEGKGSSIALSVMAAMNAADDLKTGSADIVRKSLNRENGVPDVSR